MVSLCINCACCILRFLSGSGHSLVSLLHFGLRPVQSDRLRDRPSQFGIYAKSTGFANIIFLVTLENFEARTSAQIEQGGLFAQKIVLQNGETRLYGILAQENLFLARRILEKCADVYRDVHEACFFKSNTARSKFSKLEFICRSNACIFCLIHTGKGHSGLLFLCLLLVVSPLLHHRGKHSECRCVLLVLLVFQQ